nr:unnamed protein product [Spirometra erinaceieuropaei]
MALADVEVFEDAVPLVRSCPALNEIRTSGELKELVIEVKHGAILNAHRIILAARIPSLRAALNGALGKDNSVLKWPTVPLSLANSLIHYVYTGQLEMTQANAMGIVMFAKMMKLSDLENWGVQFMANRVNLENLATTNELAQRLDNLPIAAAAAAAAENASVENRWCQLRDTVQSTALAVLGRAPANTRTDHPTEDNKAAFYRSRRQLQQRLREMQDAWTARKAEEIQGYADRNEWKNFFSAIKAVYGPPTKGSAPLLSADGSTLLTEKTQILQRWAEHFQGVLNRPSVISDVAIARLPQVETNVDLDLPPSLQETIRAVQKLSNGKAPGSDAIPAEVYKHGGPQLMDHLTALFQEMWRQGEVPQDFKDANIVHLYKRKGNRQVCDNHRGTYLLNIAGKIFARILLNRLNNHLEQGLLPESQCGLGRYRGTTDMIFAARQLQEKCQEMRTHLYSTFVDLTKAFDTVNREGLWKIMQKFGCPERFTQMVRQLHDGMMARVTDNGAVSEAFAVTNGVKQGCVLAPTLFILMFSAMLMDAYRDERPGIRIAYRKAVVS